MTLISKIEAAMKLGVSIELIDYFSKYCPKSGEDIKLQVVRTELGDMYDDTALIKFNNYLNKPWPHPKKTNRPAIPEPIKRDIKEESHYSCAICGHMDNGEVAHIEPVHKTLNNSPDNLIYLCPNHHKKYDHGYTINTNITIEEVKAAKLLKRKSRCRILKYEVNATRYLLTLIKFLRSIESKLKSEQNKNIAEIYLTEMQKLTETIPELSHKAHEQASKDEFATKTEEILSKRAPELSKYVSPEIIKRSEKDLRNAVTDIISQTSHIIIDIDEVECPHCEGRGQTGLVGDFCAYCGGSCMVTQEERDDYDRDGIDEVECPHCEGRGRTGLIGDLCAYCGGSCMVTQEERDDYDRDGIDEVECPHCEGRGQTGLVGDFCALCNGSCVVTQEIASAYSEKYGR
jgi:RecJ-like exonuclease